MVASYDTTGQRCAEDDRLAEGKRRYYDQFYRYEPYYWPESRNLLLDCDKTCGGAHAPTSVKSVHHVVSSMFKGISLTYITRGNDFINSAS
jgi:hypothetical protein